MILFMLDTKITHFMLWGFKKKINDQTCLAIVCMLYTWIRVIFIILGRYTTKQYIYIGKDCIMKRKDVHMGVYQGDVILGSV